MTQHYSGGSDKTIAKLVILDKYLWSYLKIVGQWDCDVWYVDTHSGTGYTLLEDYDVEVPGSTLRALDHDFDRYYFYEKDPDHFELLAETIESELDIEMSRSEIPDEGIQTATADKPCIRVLNTDCNSGVKWLVNNSREYVPWFVFIDPERLSVDVDLVERLIQRGNTDILLNFQTTAYRRSGAKNADHAHGAVENGMGEEWPVDGSDDDFVEAFKQQVVSPTDYAATSRKMVSEGSKQWRYDLIFASGAGVAEKIMTDIMRNRLRKEVMDEIKQARRDSSRSQRGLETYSIEIEGHNEEVADSDGQRSLGDF